MSTAVMSTPMFECSEHLFKVRNFPFLLYLFIQYSWDFEPEATIGVVNIAQQLYSLL